MCISHSQASLKGQILDESTFHYLDLIFSLPKFERREDADVLLVSANGPVLYFNTAIKTNFNGNAAQRIEEINHYFSARSKSFSWLVTPGSRPQNLGEQILQHGGEFLESLPYMHLYLDDLQRNVLFPSGFHWERVRTPEMLYAWTSIYCQARSYPQATDQLFEIFSDLSLEEGAALQLILGYLGKRPVATYSVFLDDEIAGFYSLSTLPEERGQGLGTAISIAAADLALEQGYEAVMLHSEPLSRNLCKRLGFVEVFGEMHIYRTPVRNLI